MTAAASIERIRGRFPALERRHAKFPVAYFDGPGGTQVSRSVAEAMVEYLYHHNANTHWSYPTSEETDRLLEQARGTLADFLGCGPDEVAFGANMTTLTFHVSRALGRRMGRGDEIVVTEANHDANVAPWREIAEERGLVVRMIRIDPRTGQLDGDAMARAITDRTKVVAVGAASNAIGAIYDVARAAEMAKTAGALTFVDAVHFAPHELVDVARLGCDLLSCSAYKFYGPHVGVLYGRRELLESLDVPKVAPAPNHAPERMETGTQNHEGIVGAAAAVDFLASLSALPSSAPRRERLADAFAAMHAHGHALLVRLTNGLGRIDGVRLFPPEPETPRTPTVAFAVGDLPSEEVARRLSKRGVFVSHGDFYAPALVARLGQEEQGLVRAGCACYTTGEEVARLIDGVQEIARG